MINEAEKGWGRDPLVEGVPPGASVVMIKGNNIGQATVIVVETPTGHM